MYIPSSSASITLMIRAWGWPSASTVAAAAIFTRRNRSTYFFAFSFMENTLSFSDLCPHGSAAGGFRKVRTILWHRHQQVTNGQLQGIAAF